MVWPPLPWDLPWLGPLPGNFAEHRGAIHRGIEVLYHLLQHLPIASGFRSEATSSPLECQISRMLMYIDICIFTSREKDIDIWIHKCRCMCIHASGYHIHIYIYIIYIYILYLYILLYIYMHRYQTPPYGRRIASR